MFRKRTGQLGERDLVIAYDTSVFLDKVLLDLDIGSPVRSDHMETFTIGGNFAADGLIDVFHEDFIDFHTKKVFNVFLGDIDLGSLDCSGSCGLAGDRNGAAADIQNQFYGSSETAVSESGADGSLESSSSFAAHLEDSIGMMDGR